MLDAGKREKGDKNDVEKSRRDICAISFSLPTDDWNFKRILADYLSWQQNALCSRFETFAWIFPLWKTFLCASTIFHRNPKCYAALHQEYFCKNGFHGISIKFSNLHWIFQTMNWLNGASTFFHANFQRFYVTRVFKAWLEFWQTKFDSRDGNWRVMWN